MVGWQLFSIGETQQSHAVKTDAGLEPDQHVFEVYFKLKANLIIPIIAVALCSPVYMHCSVGHFKDIKLFLKHFVLKIVSKGLQMDIFDRKYKGALRSC